MRAHIKRQLVSLAIVLTVLALAAWLGHAEARRFWEEIT